MAELARLEAQQQDSQNLSTNETTSPAFHPFSRLPIELRLKIWKAACLPCTDTDRGLHYVTLDIIVEDEEDFECNVVFDDNLVGYDEEFEIESDDTGYVTLRALKRTWEKSSKARNPVNHLNKSAYLWDAGLWLACKESRSVIAKHLDFDGWLTLREQPNDGDPSRWYNKDFPSTIVPYKSNEKWRPVVKPAHDIFCIDTTKLRSLSRSLFGMKLLAPLLGTRTFTIKERWNIAFKFDHSWNDAFPHRVDRLKRENSPRGLLANWVEVFSQDSFPLPSPWIIDDDVRWVAQPGQVFETIYRDCDGEYVQTDWDATRDNTISRLKGAVTRFMTSFGVLCDEEDMYDLLGMGLSPMPFSTKEHIRLLVRKDKVLQAYMEENSGSDDDTEDEAEFDSQDESDDLSDGSGGSDEEDE